MTQITNYAMVTAEDPGDLSRFVDEQIAKGWQPYGSPFGWSRDIYRESVTTFCQAMVEYGPE